MLSLPRGAEWNGKLAWVLLDAGRAAAESACLVARGYACGRGAADAAHLAAALAAAIEQLRAWQGRAPAHVVVLADAPRALAALQLAATAPRHFNCLIAAGVPAGAAGVAPDLAAYAEAGGRLILFHDPVAPESSLDAAIGLQAALERRAGSLAAAAAFARLFILPAPDDGGEAGRGGWRTDWLVLAEKWLEQRPPRPPDDPVLWRLTAEAPPVLGLFAPGPIEPASIAETRPAYPYPLRVLYKGRGERADWRSWYAPGIYRRDLAPPAEDELPQPIAQDPSVRAALQIDPAVGPVAVVGATGRLGLEIVQALRSHGVSVRALARDRDRAAALLPHDVDRVIVDIRDAEAFCAALRGTQRVVFAASATAGGTGDNTPRAVEYDAVCTLAEAARSLALAQVLLVSSAACTQREHIHNLWGDILLWKLRSEDVLRSSGVPYTVLRPTGLRAHAGGRRGIRLIQGDRIALGEEIARADVASLCVALLGDPHALGKTFEAYNDDSLPPGSWVGTFQRLQADQ